MPYLGNTPPENFVNVVKQDITGNGGQNYSLNHAVSSAADLEVFVNNVQQEPTTAYTVSGSTITFDEAVSATDDIYVIFRARSIGTAHHPADLDLSAKTGTFNRTSTEGSALTLQKDGTTFGTLGVDGSDLVIDGPSGHTGLRMTTSGLLPRQNGAIIDNTIDLGSTGYRYNDLYLGGQVFTNVIGRSDDTNTTIDFPGSDVLEFYTAGVKRMNIDANGHVGIGNASPSCQLHVNADDDDEVLQIHADSSTYTSNVIYVQTTKAASNTHRYFKANESDGSTTSVQILGNGNVQNINNSFGAISDERVKQDITDADSQWDDIKAIKVKNFKLKYRVSVDGDDAPKQVGVVAQDLEAAGMNGLIEHIEPDPYQKDTLGIEKDVKSVKYSILHMKAVKALQEAMTRIETLETKVAKLEAE